MMFRIYNLRLLLITIAAISMITSSDALAQSAATVPSDQTLSNQVPLRRDISAADYTTAPRVFVVLPFKAARAGYPSSGCTSTDASAGVVLPALSEDLTLATAQQVASRGKVRVLASAMHAPPGAIIISGCITRAIAGDATQRLIGLNMGASELGAHVQIQRKTGNSIRLIGEFDESVRGANRLPPIGPVGLFIHVARASKLTLNGDVKKLAAQIAVDILPGN
jgi:hypothetical protein